MAVTKTRVSFEVDSDQVVGSLHVPDGKGPFAGLIFDGPLTSVKEQVTGNYAGALAERGFVTLAVDHRHFGESDGKPRQYEHPGHKAQDSRGALDFLSSLPEVDKKRFGAVGICAGAGYLAPVVAQDARIRAFGAVAGFFHDAEQQKKWMRDTYEPMIERARAARVQWEETGEAETIPAVGDGEVAMPLPEAFEYYGTERGAVANYVNAFAIMSREHTLPWDAQSAAPQIKVPTLIIHSENALAPSLARAFFEHLGGAKQQLWVDSLGQIDFYDDPARIEPAAEQLAEHFRENLAS